MSRGAPSSEPSKASDLPADFDGPPTECGSVPDDCFGEQVTDTTEQASADLRGAKSDDT